MADLTFPFGPAPKYTELGHYTIGYLVDDSELLCADCVNDESNPVHMGGISDGWRIEALVVLDEDSYESICAHCYKEFFPDESDNS